MTLPTHFLNMKSLSLKLQLDYLNEAGNVFENGSIPRMQTPYLRQDENLPLAHRS